MRFELYCLSLGLVLAVTGCSLNPLGLSEPSDSYVRSGYDFSQVDKVAIVDVVGDVQGEVIKNQIAEYFTAQLLKKGYAPIERQRVQGILGQTDISVDRIHPELYAVEAGQTLDMPAVLLISVPSFGDEISMTAKLLEVDTGTALWLGRASKSYKKDRASRNDLSEDRFGDDFTDSLYRYNMGFEETPRARKSDPRLTAMLTFKDEHRVSDLVETLCKSLPERKASGGGFGSVLLGLIDSRPAKSKPTPERHVRNDLPQPEASTPGAKDKDVVTQEKPVAPVQKPREMVVQGAPRASVPETTTPAPVRQPVQTYAQPPTRAYAQPPTQTYAQPPTRTYAQPPRTYAQPPTRTPDSELRVISPGTTAPIHTSPKPLRIQRPKSIFEQGFEDALAKQSTYITDSSAPKLTPPLEPLPQPEAQPAPQTQPEPVYRPVQPQTIWRQPPPQVEPQQPKPRHKKSFWRTLLGLD